MSATKGVNVILCQLWVLVLGKFNRHSMANDHAALGSLGMLISWQLLVTSGD
jgi:hypothetical protein